MSNPTREELKAEWENTDMKIEITIHGNSLYRNYNLTDGLVPQSAKEGIQEMADELLDTNEI